MSGTVAAWARDGKLVIIMQSRHIDLTDDENTGDGLRP